MTQTLLPPRLDVVPSLRDRCDQCGAAAKLAFMLPDGGELTFCGHHANKHADQILSVAEYVAVEDGFDWWGADRAVG